MGEMDAAALTINEFYQSYVRAGFTPEQAMELIKAHIMSEGQNK